MCAPPSLRLGLAGMLLGSPAMRHCNVRLAACLLGISLTCCKHASPSSTAAHADCDGLQWLVGSWTTTDGSGSTELWEAIDGGTLRGKSVTRSEGEVVYSESLRIVQGPGGLEYQASPEDQEPNVFVLDQCGPAWARFVDPTHDWPQSIVYQRTGESLRATVSGTARGSERTETWSWTRRPSKPVVSLP